IARRVVVAADLPRSVNGGSEAEAASMWIQVGHLPAGVQEGVRLAAGRGGIAGNLPASVDPEGLAPVSAERAKIDDRIAAGRESGDGQHEEKQENEKRCENRSGHVPPP